MITSAPTFLVDTIRLFDPDPPWHPIARVAPHQILAHVGGNIVLVQRIDNYFQSTLILTAYDDGDSLFEKNNRLTWSEASGRGYRLHNMTIPEDLAQVIQVICFIACLGNNRPRFEFL